MPESARIGESARYFVANQPMHYGIEIVYSLEVEHCTQSYAFSNFLRKPSTSFCSFQQSLNSWSTQLLPFWNAPCSSAFLSVITPLHWLPERPVQLPSKQSSRRIESTLTSAPPITFRPLQWRPLVPLVVRPFPLCQTLDGLSRLRLESLSPTNSSCRASLWQYNEGMQHRSVVLHM